jgi:hypothetical protein
MKVRTIAIGLIFTLAAWLPVMAQQTAAPQAAAAPTDGAKSAEKSACACCTHTKDHGKAATGDHALSSCCEGKDMACCKNGAKDNKSAATCCAGKDAKMCSKKDAKECCGKDTMVCNTKDAKNCCAGPAKECCHGASQS